VKRKTLLQCWSGNRGRPSMEAHLQPLKQIFPADWGKRLLLTRKTRTVYGLQKRLLIGIRSRLLWTRCSQCWHTTHIFPADWSKDEVADKKDKNCLCIMEQIVNQYS
jgi:hypothetical protein